MTYLLLIIYLFEIMSYFFIYKLNIISFNDFVKKCCFVVSKINIYYVKIFQWQIMDNTNNVELRDFFTEFTNNVFYTEDDIDKKSLNDIIEFAKSNDNILTIDKYVPINSGTIALVFKGKLNDKEIVIKMLRKDVEKNILNCLNTMNTCLNILHYIPFISLVILNKNTILNLKKCLIEQCNFHKEIENNEIFFEGFKKSKNIVIPKVYKEYTEFNNKLIIMEFLSGKTLNDLNSDELLVYHSHFNKYVMNSLIFKKIIHCDLHSGNIIFIKDNEQHKIGLIDFGMCKKMNDFEYKFISDFVFAILNNDMEKVFVIIAKNIIDREEELDDYIIKNITQELLELHKQNKLIKNGYIKHNDFNIILNSIYKNKVILTVKKDICELFLNVISGFSVLEILSNNMSLTEIYNKFLIPDKLICQ